MAYDPQANRRRPKPAAEEPAPVEALLGEAAPGAARDSVSTSVTDDPPPSPAVTPEPADPVSDTLVLSSGLATALGALVALLTLRHFWKRRKRKQAED